MRAKERNDFYRSIGRLVVSWSFLEVGIDLLFLKLWNMTGRSRYPNPDHNLSEKIKRCRSLLSDVSLGCSAELKEILDAADMLKLERHDVVHGSVIGHKVADGTLSVTQARLLQPPKKPRHSPKTRSSIDLDKASDEVDRLHGRLFDLLYELTSGSAGGEQSGEQSHGGKA